MLTYEREEHKKEGGREGGTGGAAWNGGKGKGRGRGKGESQLRDVWIRYENWRAERVGSRAVKDKKGTLTRCESTWRGGNRRGAAGKRERVKGGGLET
jgi:hypothetical protein